MPPRLARSGQHERTGSDPDSLLVARAQRGDREAFEELVRRHSDRVRGIVRRLSPSEEEADEVTQEAFLRAWRGIGGFKGEARFFTWLCRVAINETERRRGREPAGWLGGSLDEEGAVEPADVRHEPHMRAASGELPAELERAVRALGVKYRAPLILRDIEGLSTSEAAAVLGVSEAAFKSRLHRARLTVKDAVRSYAEYEA